MLTFVSATRSSKADFMAQAMLGQSLRAMDPMGPFNLHLFSDNRRPLGACYNEAIAVADPDAILVFLHDDLSILDWHVGQRLEEALSEFDVVGVAGNRRRQAHQETWWMMPSRPFQGARILDRPDDDFLSGSISHGRPGDSSLTVYGAAPAAVALLDGVFLAARAARLQQSSVRFDPRFGFHFYDLDFCRSAELAGLKIGTWPIALLHASGGDVQSPAWSESLELYLRKWGS